jgi:hypothetical protein
MKIEPRQNHNECFHCGLQKGTIEDTGVLCANGHEHQFKDGGAPVSKQNPARMSEELKKEFREMIENSGWKIPLDGFGERSREEFLGAIICFWELKLAKQQEEFVKMIDEIPTEVPEYENNDYDKGRKDFKADIKSKLNI